MTLFRLQNIHFELICFIIQSQICMYKFRHYEWNPTYFLSYWVPDVSVLWVAFKACKRIFTVFPEDILRRNDIKV